MLNLTSSAAKSSVPETRRAVVGYSEPRGVRLTEGKGGGGGARALQSRRLVGCGESGGRNGRKAGRATEGVSAVWVCGGRVGAGPGSGLYFEHTIRLPPSCKDSPLGNGGHSVCFHFSSWKKVAAKRPSMGSIPQDLTPSKILVPEVISGLGASSRAPGA